MKCSVMDIGSNSIRLHVYEYEGGELRLLLKKKRVAGLASYIKDGYMTNRGIRQLISVLKSYGEVVRDLDIEHSYVMATASIRNAENREEILARVYDALGIKIDLISGREEAMYGYTGIARDYDFQDGIILDIGGGSTEITIVQEEKVVYASSIGEGSLSLRTKYVEGILPKKSEIKKIQKKLKKLLQEQTFPLIPKHMNCYGMGGTIRSAGNISQELYDLPGNHQLQPKMIKKLWKSLVQQDRETLEMVLHVSPARIHTMTTGMMILHEIMEFFEPKELFISELGLREGYLFTQMEKIRS
ncbi:MAG: phosphatase [Tissierellia bacterium]|nr:phosphatase [Tissierellia bacterium]